MFIEEPQWESFTDFEGGLTGDQTHVFRINISECYATISGLYSGILSDTELDRASRFFHFQDRASYVVGKYYLRKILSCFVSLPPNELHFSTVGNKKPVLRGVEFNMSHSNGYVVVAVNSSPVGVDLEYINPTFDFTPMLDSCLGVEELLFLADTDKRSGFYWLWTRKEAVLKASAEGLTESLREVNCLADQMFRMGTKFELRTFGFDEHYVLSIATAASGDCKFWQVMDLAKQ